MIGRVIGDVANACVRTTVTFGASLIACVAPRLVALGRTARLDTVDAIDAVALTATTATTTATPFRIAREALLPRFGSSCLLTSPAQRCLYLMGSGIHCAGPIFGFEAIMRA